MGSRGAAGATGAGRPRHRAGLLWPHPFHDLSVFRSEGHLRPGLRLLLQGVSDKRFVRLSEGAHGWGSERRRDGEETAALFRASLERLLGGYCSRFAESEASPSCSPETQLLGENNHRAEHRAPSRKEGRKPQNKREKYETMKEAPSRTRCSSPPHAGWQLETESGCFSTWWWWWGRWISAPSQKRWGHVLSPGNCECDTPGKGVFLDVVN